jgi:hypothetical protein
MGGICRGHDTCSCLVRESVGLFWIEEDTLDCRIWISVHWVLYIENRSRHTDQLTELSFGTCLTLELSSATTRIQ